VVVGAVVGVVGAEVGGTVVGGTVVGAEVGEACVVVGVASGAGHATGVTVPPASGGVSFGAHPKWDNTWCPPLVLPSEKWFVSVTSRM
jgi:hypothetical protein